MLAYVSLCPTPTRPPSHTHTQETRVKSHNKPIVDILRVHPNERTKGREKGPRHEGTKVRRDEGTKDEGTREEAKERRGEGRRKGRRDEGKGRRDEGTKEQKSSKSVCASQRLEIQRKSDAAGPGFPRKQDQCKLHEVVEEEPEPVRNVISSLSTEVSTSTARMFPSVNLIDTPGRRRDFPWLP